jgi:hypothetical protein
MRDIFKSATVTITREVHHCDHGNFARGLAEIPKTGSYANGYYRDPSRMPQRLTKFSLKDIA